MGGMGLLVGVAVVLVVCNVNVQGRVIQERVVHERVETFLEVSVDTSPIEQSSRPEVSAKILKDIQFTKLISAYPLSDEWICKLPGHCFFCAKDTDAKICVHAFAVSSVGYLVVVETDGKPFLKVDAKESGPMVCEQKIPGLPGITDICIHVTNDSVSDMAGCTSLSMQVHGKTETLDMKCFKIPYAGASDVKAGNDAIAVNDVNTDDHVNTDDNVKAVEGIKIDNDVMKVVDARSGALAGDKGVEGAKACKDEHGYNICAVAKGIPGGIHVELRVNEMSLMEVDIKDNTPRATCKKTIPKVPVTDVCLSFFNVNITALHGCAKVTCKYHGHDLGLVLGCFDAPKGDTRKEDDLSNRDTDVKADSDVKFNNNVEADNNLRTGVDAEAGTGVDVMDVDEAKVCKTVSMYEICAVGKRIPGGMHVDLQAQGFTMMGVDIKDNAPKPKCISQIPSIPGVTDVCLSFYNVNIITFHGCAHVTYKAQEQPGNLDIGCFDVPNEDKRKKDDVSNRDTAVKADSDVKFKNNVEADNNIMMALEARSGAGANVLGVKEAKVCTLVYSYEICAVAKRITDGMHVDLLAMGITMVSVDIKDNAPKPTCISTIPFIQGVTDVCLSFYNVSIITFHGCANVTYKVHEQPRYVNLGCFDVPNEDKPRLLTAIQPRRHVRLHQSHDVIEMSMRSTDDFTVNECVPGKCTLCVDVREGHTLCAVVTQISGGFHLLLNLDKTGILQTDVTTIGLSKKCIRQIPQLPDVTNPCLLIHVAVLNPPTACLRVSFDYKGKPGFMYLGCFTILPQTRLPQLDFLRKIKLG